MSLSVCHTFVFDSGTSNTAFNGDGLHVSSAGVQAEEVGRK